MSIWVGARVVGGLTIVLGLLALVAVSWAARGVTDATQLFQLLQGVILGTLGWLYGTQGFESARQQALREGTARELAVSTADMVEEQVAELERTIQRYDRVLEELGNDPLVRQKIDEAMRRVKE